MAPKRKTKMKEISLENLTVEDVFCIACRCIYLQPVTMPCGHTLCLECFKNMVSITAYQCPTCRMRISNWLRKFKNNWDLLVNEQLWEALQQQYPVEVQKRLNDEDDGIEERIVSQGFTRVQFNQGEVKKEFDDMIINFQQENKKIELFNLELAKKIQKEEEEMYEQNKKANENLSLQDENLALLIDEKRNFEQEQSDWRFALQLQKESLQTFETETRVKVVKNNNTIPSKDLPTKGPLDKIFAKLTPENSKTKHRVEENSWSYSSLSSSSNSFQSPSTSSSISTELCTSSSVTDSSNILVDDNLDTCTCGRLLNNFHSSVPPCQFCIAQIKLLNELTIQQKNDFLIAKDLEKKMNMDNFEDYNLRKRSSTPMKSNIPNKIKKLSKGQQTLEKMFLD